MRIFRGSAQLEWASARACSRWWDARPGALRAGFVLRCLNTTRICAAHAGDFARARCVPCAAACARLVVVSSASTTSTCAADASASRPSSLASSRHVHPIPLHNTTWLSLVLLRRAPIPLLSLACRYPARQYLLTFAFLCFCLRPCPRRWSYRRTNGCVL